MHTERDRRPLSLYRLETTLSLCVQSDLGGVPTEIGPAGFRGGPRPQRLGGSGSAWHVWRESQAGSRLAAASCFRRYYYLILLVLFRYFYFFSFLLVIVVVIFISSLFFVSFAESKPSIRQVIAHRCVRVRIVYNKQISEHITQNTERRTQNTEHRPQNTTVRSHGDIDV